MFDDPTGCYAPSWPVAIDREPRMNVAKMGDGYEQRILDGLNWMETTWNLKWPMRPRAILMDMAGQGLQPAAGRCHRLLHVGIRLDPQAEPQGL